MSNFKTEVSFFLLRQHETKFDPIYFLIHIPALILNDSLVHIVPKKMFVFIIFH